MKNNTKNLFKKIIPIYSGHENSSFIVETKDKKKCVLKKFPIKKLQELEFEKSILEELSKRSKGYIKPIGNLIQAGKEIFILYEYFDGEPLSATDIEPEILKTIAGMQARMHKKLHNFSTKGKRERFSIFESNFIDIFAREEIDKNIENLISRSRIKIEKYIEEFRNIQLPHSIIHEDLELVNILKNKKNELIFIDFGECHHAPIISDIAIAIKELIVNTKGIDKKLIEEYIKAYHKSNPVLDYSQLDMLYFLILRRTLFMFTYLLHKGHKTTDTKNKGYSCNIDVEYKILKLLLERSDLSNIKYSLENE